MNESRANTKIGITTTDNPVFGLMGNIAIMFSRLVFPLLFPFYFTIANEYERIVLFRLGRCIGVRGPGLITFLPMVDYYVKLDMRTVAFNVLKLEVLTRDSVTISVDAVVYFRISNPVKSVLNVSEVTASTKLLTQTTLLNDLGQRSLSQLLSDKDNISKEVLNVLRIATSKWGVLVERIEIKDMKLPKEIRRVMAAEAEATRESKAKVIAAEGENNASRALKEAADVISSCKGALQLRYLQTIANISAKNNKTIVFPIPVHLFDKLTA